MMFHRHRIAIALIVVLAGIALAGAAAWRSVIPGLSSARHEPPAIEVSVATLLLRASVPAEDKARINPLGGDPADIAAGQDIFRQKCEVCHAYDGSGRTEIGAGEYPRPPALRSLDLIPDGRRDFLSHTQRNPEHRHAGLDYAGGADLAIGSLHPQSADHRPNVAAGRDEWRALRRAAFSLAPPAMAAQTGPASDRHYVGSTECKSCHAGIYDRWEKTPMANVVRDPREHPDAIIPDLSKPDPLLTFTKDDIAFVYGSNWKQRYFKKVGDDYFPLPAQWDVTHKMWRQYFVTNGTDWWVPFYPPDNFQRPTGPLCDGCHSVNYDIETKTVTEWNVGCERCHGPGSEHVKPRHARPS